MYRLFINDTDKGLVTKEELFIFLETVSQNNWGKMNELEKHFWKSQGFHPEKYDPSSIRTVKER
jgi:hypothetical protein